MDKDIKRAIEKIGASQQAAAKELATKTIGERVIALLTRGERLSLKLLRHELGDAKSKGDALLYQAALTALSEALARREKI